jgi:hypothetical protein
MSDDIYQRKNAWENMNDSRVQKTKKSYGVLGIFWIYTCEGVLVTKKFWQIS